jgi:hypothetical protein
VTAVCKSAVAFELQNAKETLTVHVLEMIEAWLTEVLGALPAGAGNGVRCIVLTVEGATLGAVSV